MSTAAQAAGQPVRGGPAQQRRTSDWRWSVVQGLILYLALNLFLGSFKQQSSSKAGGGSGAASGTSQGGGGDGDPPKPPSLPLSRSVWAPSQPLDLYIFLVEAEPPTHLEVLTQFSQWAPHGLGPYAHDLGVPIDFHAPEYAPLLRPSRTGTGTGPIYSTAYSDKVLPAIKFPNLTFDQPSLDLRADLGSFPISDAVRRGNHSIWAELFLCAEGASPNPDDASHYPLTVHRQRKLLTRLFARKKRRVERNLFDKSGAATAETAPENEVDEDEAWDDKKKPPIGTHWHPNLTLALVPFRKDDRLVLSAEPPPSLQFIFPVMTPTQAQEAAHLAAFDPSTRFRLPVLKERDDATGTEGGTGTGTGTETETGTETAYHYPVLFPNDFWLLRGHMHPINAAVTSLPLHINLYTTTPWKFKMQSNMNAGWEAAQNGQATGLASQTGPAEIDMVKQILLETSATWLILTVLVSLLHSLFEVLAFSSDIGDWRKKDDLSGISIGSIMTNVVTQVIILLYLLDSSEETSFMIIAGQGAGAAIEAWKLTKVLKIGIERRTAAVQQGGGAQGVLGRLLPFRIRIQNKRPLSAEERKTAVYDRLAFRIVGAVALPVLGAYSIYSALYNTHRSWYSYTVQTLTSFVYFFGFASLIPQLIVNYHLKSTAGFSSKTLIYKILGTVVDDFFAFAIPQPTLHRLACFRDDVVFLIFLYQRYLYGIDPTRRNELGEVVDKEGAKRKELAQAAATGRSDADPTKSGKDELKNGGEVLGKDGSASSSGSTSVTAERADAREGLKSRKGKGTSS